MNFECSHTIGKRVWTLEKHVLRSESRFDILYAKRSPLFTTSLMVGKDCYSLSASSSLWFLWSYTVLWVKSKE